MITYRPYHFPPLHIDNDSQLDKSHLSMQTESTSTQLQTVYTEAKEKRHPVDEDAVYQVGYEAGHSAGWSSGLARGQAIGFEEAQKHAHTERETLVQEICAPLDAILRNLKVIQEDYQAALRKEMIELVEKVARQVIRCELTLQPAQLLALVDETLATLPTTEDEVYIHLNPAECERIQTLVPEYAGQWNLIADVHLEPGECLVKIGSHEADAGCNQRLEACMDQVKEQLLHLN